MFSTPLPSIQSLPLTCLSDPFGSCPLLSRPLSCRATALDSSTVASAHLDSNPLSCRSFVSRRGGLRPGKLSRLEHLGAASPIKLEHLMMVCGDFAPRPACAFRAASIQGFRVTGQYAPMLSLRVLSVGLPYLSSPIVSIPHTYPLTCRTSPISYYRLAYSPLPSLPLSCPSRRLHSRTFESRTFL